MKKWMLMVVMFALAIGANARAEYYVYDGNAALSGPLNSYDSLDGSWDHNNGDDNWDGSVIGGTLVNPGNGPGGYLSITEGAVTFLRVQDCGDAGSSYGFNGSNRKLYMNRPLVGVSDTFMDEGVYFSFRMRIATTGTLDQEYLPGGTTPNPWPSNGIGQPIFNSGCGMIGIKQNADDAQISFGLAHAGEVNIYGGFESVTTDVLVMNNLVGTTISTGVDTTDAGYTARNYIPLTDATQWNNFEVTIVKGGLGTHQVTVVVNGVPAGTFDVTAGISTRYNANVINIGTNSPWATAFDIDYVAVPGPAAHTPDPADGETGVARDLSNSTIPGNFSWQAPEDPELLSGIVNYDFYLDPNETKVRNRDAGCMIVQTNLTSAQYNPTPIFDFSQVYYWAVDTKYNLSSDALVHIGRVPSPWMFQVIGAGPVVDAGSDIVTAMQFLPVGLAGTVTDETNDVTAVQWEIIGYPGDPENGAVLMTDRGGNDGGVNPDLLRDFIGTDNTRSGNPLILTLSGLPAGTYVWKSYHHDPEIMTGMFDVTVRDADGDTTTTNIDISNGPLASFEDITKFTTQITSNGTSDVQLAFSHQTKTPVELSCFVMNGFELTDIGDNSLKIDFSRSGDTPIIEAGYEGWLATHKDLPTFVPQDFSVFSTTVTVGVTWGPGAFGLINASVTPTNSSLSAPTATFTTDTFGPYVIQLTATDAQANVGSDTMEIYVGENACDAAQQVTGWTGFNYYDRDQDCDVDLADFAVFAVEWLDDISLTGTLVE